MNTGTEEEEAVASQIYKVQVGPYRSQFPKEEVANLMTTERYVFFTYLDFMEHRHRFITFCYLDPVDFDSKARYGTEEEREVISHEAG